MKPTTLRYILLSLVIIGFLGQSFSYGNNHQQPSQHSDKPEMTHHSDHHGMEMESHDNKKITSHQTMECCDHQCDCEHASCSVIYALNPDDLIFSNYKMWRGRKSANTPPIHFISSRYRPPRPQYV